VKTFTLVPLLFLGCSGVSLNDAPPDADPDARALLPRDLGVFVTESSTSLDAAAIESILPNTHRRATITGFSLATDVQLRRLRDSRGVEHIYTLQASDAIVVERDREGRSVKRLDVAAEGVPVNLTNPLDLAFDRHDNLWITRHGARSLIVVSPNDKPLTTVDLSAFADDDGIPDMSAIEIVDRTAYVALRRLEKGFGTRKNTSTIVAIDTDTFVPRPFLELPAKDPGAKFQAHEGALFISCIGGPLLKDGPDQSAALVRIDPATATARALLPPAVAGGFVTAFALVAERGYAIVASFEQDNPTKVVRFDLGTGAIDATWASSSDYRFWDIVAVRGTSLLVADRSEQAPGLQVLDMADGSRRGKIPTRLPPIEALVLAAP